nr:hypothetical protein [Bacteroidota bacterium]
MTKEKIFAKLFLFLFFICNVNACSSFEPKEKIVNETEKELALRLFTQVKSIDSLGHFIVHFIDSHHYMNSFRIDTNSNTNDTIIASLTLYKSQLSELQMKYYNYLKDLNIDSLREPMSLFFNDTIFFKVPCYIFESNITKISSLRLLYKIQSRYRRTLTLEQQILEVKHGKDILYLMLYFKIE